MTRQASVVGFVLWVLGGDQPPHKRASYPTYADCIVVGQAQVDSLKKLVSRRRMAVRARR